MVSRRRRLNVTSSSSVHVGAIRAPYFWDRYGSLRAYFSASPGEVGMCTEHHFFQSLDCGSILADPTIWCMPSAPVLCCCFFCCVVLGATRLVLCLPTVVAGGLFCCHGDTRASGRPPLLQHYVTGLGRGVCVVLCLVSMPK